MSLISKNPEQNVLHDPQLRAQEVITLCRRGAWPGSIPLAKQNCNWTAQFMKWYKLRSYIQSLAMQHTASVLSFVHADDFCEQSKAGLVGQKGAA